MKKIAIIVIVVIIAVSLVTGTSALYQSSLEFSGGIVSTQTPKPTPTTPPSEIEPPLGEVVVIIEKTLEGCYDFTIKYLCDFTAKNWQLEYTGSPTMTLTSITLKQPSLDYIPNDESVSKDNTKGADYALGDFEIVFENNVDGTGAYEVTIKNNSQGNKHLEKGSYLVIKGCSKVPLDKKAFLDFTIDSTVGPKSITFNVFEYLN